MKQDTKVKAYGKQLRIFLASSSSAGWRASMHVSHALAACWVSSRLALAACFDGARDLSREFENAVKNSDQQSRSRATKGSSSERRPADVRRTSFSMRLASFNCLSAERFVSCQSASALSDLSGDAQFSYGKGFRSDFNPDGVVFDSELVSSSTS